MFWSLFVTRVAFIWVENKVKTLLELFSNQIDLFMWCAAAFLASLLQSSVSHDPSEIILIYWSAAQETFLIISNVENSCDY